jgi:hypothetical protein
VENELHLEIVSVNSAPFYPGYHQIYASINKSLIDKAKIIASYRIRTNDGRVPFCGPT